MHMPKHLVDHLDIVQKEMQTLLNQDQSWKNYFGGLIRNGEQSPCCVVDLHNL